MTMVVGALLVAGIVVVVSSIEGDDESFCRGTDFLPGRPTLTEGDLTLIIDMPAAQRSNDRDCLLGFIDAQDRAVTDGVLFDDCVIWWYDGRESTAEGEGFDC